MTTDPVTPESAPEPAPIPPPAAPKQPITETRPEILVGAAAAGGFVLARIIGALRGR